MSSRLGAARWLHAGGVEMKHSDCRARGAASDGWVDGRVDGWMDSVDGRLDDRWMPDGWMGGWRRHGRGASHRTAAAPWAISEARAASLEKACVCR